MKTKHDTTKESDGSMESIEVQKEIVVQKEVESIDEILKDLKMEKSRIRETLNLSTDANHRTLFFFFFFG